MKIAFQYARRRRIFLILQTETIGFPLQNRILAHRFRKKIASGGMSSSLCVSNILWNNSIIDDLRGKSWSEILSPEAKEVYRKLTSKWNTVIPRCQEHSNTRLENWGWNVSSPTKKQIIGGGTKRKAVSMDLDLQTYKPRPLPNATECTQKVFDAWLADSLPAWSQLVSSLRIKKQTKRQRQVRRWWYELFLCLLKTRTLWPS